MKYILIIFLSILISINSYGQSDELAGEALFDAENDVGNYDTNRIEASNIQLLFYSDVPIGKDIELWREENSNYKISILIKVFNRVFKLKNKLGDLIIYGSNNPIFIEDKSEIRSFSELYQITEINIHQILKSVFQGENYFVFWGENEKTDEIKVFFIHEGEGLEGGIQTILKLTPSNYSAD